MSSGLIHSHELLVPELCRVLLVDVQDRLLTVVRRPARLVSHCKLLCEAARLFQAPIFATEQYPQGLGSLAADLQPYVQQRVAKQQFSALSALGWTTAAESADARRYVILAGVEAHICVLQTAFDLLAAGYRVQIPVDAVSSRNRADAKRALERLANAGADLTTVETIAFEWCRTADAPQFKALSALVRDKSTPKGSPRAT